MLDVQSAALTGGMASTAHTTLITNASTPDQSARIRDAIEITIPHRALGVCRWKCGISLQFGTTFRLVDLKAITLCRYCAANVTDTMCDWTLLHLGCQKTPL